MSDADLRKVYDSFIPSGTIGGMDASKWAKCCRDCKVIDGKLITETDVEIVFNKIKTKEARKITFEEFKLALMDLSKKLTNIKTSKEQVDEIFNKIVVVKGKSAVSAQKTNVSGDYDKIVDTSKYSGYGKKLDESGKGKGMDGRKDFDEKSQDGGYVGS